MNQPQRDDVLREALKACRSGWLAIGAFSFFTNLLMLTGPLYMLQVYDRVLASGSLPTLVALTILVAVLFLAFGLLELVRSRLLSHIGNRLERLLGEPTFDALLGRAVARPGRRGDQPLRDLSSLRGFLTSPAPLVVFDLPWTPVFIGVICLLHVWLGLLAIVGVAILAALAIANELVTRSSFQLAGEEARAGNVVASGALRNVEAVEAMGMRPAMRRLWQDRNGRALAAQTVANGRAASFSASTKALRLFLQSAVLGLGALLAVQQEISPGMMIAASIIVGRALAPIEQAVGQWRSFVSSRESYRRLKDHLQERPGAEARMRLPRAEGSLQVEHVFAAPPGVAKPLLRDVTFALRPGDTLGIIGPSAAGKSTLARVLVGIWPALGGAVRLDGADVSKWDRDDLGPQIGYLPQDVELFAGKVSDNIARFSETVDPAKVVEAAKLAGVHEMILHLPEGYDTEIGEGGRHLSAGQRQRLALARALYGDPALIVLDEPNSNLDAAGDEALSKAIEALKAKGKTVVVIAHRPSAIAAVEKLLSLENGTVRAFGAKDEVMRQVLRPTAPAPQAPSLRTV
jgi:PrtD family type I secretion system ABC transporter